MLYCPKCQSLTLSDCPVCGRKQQKLMPPKPEDPVFLLNCRMQYACMVEPILSEAGIPYSRSGALGAALSTALGSAFELYKFYVPFAAYPKAYRLITDIFGEDPEIMARLENYGMDEAEITAL